MDDTAGVLHEPTLRGALDDIRFHEPTDRGDEQSLHQEGGGAAVAAGASLATLLGAGGSGRASHSRWPY